MLFAEYIRPYADLAFRDLQLDSATELLHDQLIALGFEFVFELVPSCGQIQWHAGRRNSDGDVEYEALFVSSLTPKLYSVISKLHSQAIKSAQRYPTLP